MTLQELLVKIRADVSDYVDGVDQAKGKTQELDDSFAQSARSLETLGGKMTSVGASLTAAITLPLAGVSMAALKVASDLEMATVGFTTMLQSSERAQAHLEELRNFAMKTPFEFPELVNASKRLQALGFTAGEIIPTLRAIGDATSAMGTGSVGIERITLALGQMQSKGKVSAEEMRQLAEAGIPAWQMLTEAINKANGSTLSIADVMEKAKTGFVDGNMAVQALLEGMEKRFGGLMALQSQTLGGMWSNLKDQMTKVLSDLGTALTPLAKDMITSLSGVGAQVDILVMRFRELPEWVQGSAVAMAALAAAAGPALLVFGSLVKAIGSVGTALATASEFLGAAGIAGVLPIAATAAAAFGAAIATWKLGEIAVGLVDVVRNFGGPFLDAIGNLKDKVIETAKSMAQGFAGALGPDLISYLTSYLKAGMAALGNAIPGFGFLQVLSGYGFGTLDTIKRGVDLVNAGGPIQVADMTDRAQARANQLRADAMARERGIAEKQGKSNDASVDRKRQAAREAEAQQQQAMKDLGIRDYDAELQQLWKDYQILEKTGKFTEDQLAEAWPKLEEAALAAGGAVEEFFHKYQSSPKFADKSLDNALLVREYEREMAAQKKLRDEILSSREAAQDYANLQNQLNAIEEGAGEYVSEEAQAYARLQESVMSATAAFQKQWDIQALIKQGAANAPSVSVTNPELAQDIKGMTDLEAAMRRLGIASKDTAKQATEDYNLVHQAYLTGAKSVTTDLMAERAMLQAVITEERNSGVAISTAQAARMHQLNEQLSRQMRDTWTTTYNEVKKVFDELGKGLGNALVNLDPKKLVDSLKKIGESVISTIFDSFTKPIIEKLSDVISSALSPLVKKISDGLYNALGMGAGAVAKNLGGLPNLVQNPTEVVRQAQAGWEALGLGGQVAGPAGQVAGAAGGVAGAAGGAAKGAASAVSGLANIANIANIANAGISLVSGIVSGLQNAKMETTLNAIEKSTRYTEIATVEQADSIVETLHLIRNYLSDFTAGGVGFVALIDLTKEMNDNLTGIYSALTNGAVVPASAPVEKKPEEKPSTSSESAPESKPATYQGEGDSGGGVGGDSAPQISRGYSGMSADTGATTDSVIDLGKASKATAGALSDSGFDAAAALYTSGSSLSSSVSATDSSLQQVGYSAGIASVGIDALGRSLLDSFGSGPGAPMWSTPSEGLSGEKVYNPAGGIREATLDDLRAMGMNPDLPNTTFWTNPLQPRAPSVPGGRSIIIQNNTFSKREDLDYLMHIVKGQL